MDTEFKEYDTWYKDGGFATIKYRDGTVLSVMPASYNGFDTESFSATKDGDPIPVEKKDAPALESASFDLLDFGFTKPENTQPWYKRLGYDLVIPFTLKDLPQPREPLSSLLKGSEIILEDTKYTISAIDSFATSNIRHTINLMLKKQN